MVDVIPSIKIPSIKIPMLLIATCLLAACASPAHENTTYLGHDIQSVFVTVHSLDNYEIDGYLLDSKGLAHQIQSLTKSHSLKSMVIDPSRNASDFDQAFAVYLGEKNGLKTYRKTLLWSEKVSSEELLAGMKRSTEVEYSWSGDTLGDTLADFWDTLIYTELKLDL
ncbi:MAG: hypothetical protein COA74_04475 [Gammaproteobacteria bacterium]|nr:MAG: hypothetical protein COA74_04995 [Gammaproteobacteria bacterium]PCJ49715.1 MAG: hypothetical protein COA74_04475 [Gammaproteobacteria bacterium]